VRALPWLPGIARVVCDGFVAGEPFDACPRQVLRRQMARLVERGWVLRTGIEPEFFLLKNGPGGWQPADGQDRLDKPSYDLKSLPRQMDFLRALSCSLQACGFEVLQTDHEDAHGQYELNFAYGEALLSCDRLMLFKMAAHALAEERGMVFSMMPKPFANQPGSGMHFHVSLWQTGGTGACLFDDRGVIVLLPAGASAFASQTDGLSARLLTLIARLRTLIRKRCRDPVLLMPA
jgi:glutamine synthetase